MLFRSRYLYSTYVPTCWLMSQLVDDLVRGGEDVRAKFFDTISDYFRTGFISSSMFKEIIRCFLARGKNFTIRWYDHEIGTGGPALTVPLDFKLLVSYQFDRRGLLYMCFVCRNQFLRLMLGLAWTSVRPTAVMDTKMYGHMNHKSLHIHTHSWLYLKFHYQNSFS